MSVDALAEYLEGSGRCAVLFSGGYDSEVLLRAAAAHLGSQAVVSLTSDSPLLAGFHAGRVRAVALELGIDPVMVSSDPLTDPAFTANHGLRCYLCKKMMFRNLKEMAGRLGCRRVMDGTSTDDLSTHRPGLKAACEEGIIHPFVQAGFGRKAIAELGLELGTREEEHPSDSCLATRIPEGTPITLELIRLVERMEAPLRPLVKGRFRVRAGSGVLMVEFTGADSHAVRSNLGIIRSIARDAGYMIDLRELSG